MKLAAAAGAFVSSALWAFDFMRLPRYELAQEAKLVAVHVLLGTLIGLLVALSLRDRLSSMRLAWVAAAFTLTLAVVALLAMVGTYPQLFADRWWLQGGLLAWTQVLVTHTIGPRVLDFLCITLVGATVMVPLVRAVRYQRRRRAQLVVAALALVAVRVGLPARANVDDDGPLNVLIVAAESLRTDGLESDASMPYVASRVSEGSLYRYAVSPIARPYPGWVSTLTGTAPREHDVRHSYPSVAARRDVGPTLFTELRDRGFFTFVAADSSGGVLTGFPSGFEASRAPRLDMAALNRGSTLHRHRFSLALLRFRWFRDLFPEWKNTPMLAPPEWIVDDALDQLERAGERPFAGLVLFGSAETPYLAPYPHYKDDNGAYRGRYLYHLSAIRGPDPLTRDDVEQIGRRHLGALTAIDHAIERLLSRVDERTLVVIAGAHGDAMQSFPVPVAPMLFLGTGVREGVVSDAQVRQYDLPATVLGLLGGPTTFGDGLTLFDAEAPRPVCVETGIWRERGDAPGRLDYPEISRLVAIDPTSDEMVLRTEMENLVESAKERGLVLGHRLYREQMTTNGFERRTVDLPGLAPASDDADLPERFQKRCVDADPNLSRLYGAIVFERPAR